MKNKAKAEKQADIERRRIVTGRCGNCLMHITAVQPGGTDVEHVDGSAYCKNGGIFTAEKRGALL